MPAIRVRDLAVEYRKPFRPCVRAVDGISFDVGAGEIVGFIGVNGSGKSSTIRTLMGFQPAASGSAEIFGVDSKNPAAHERIGFLPETAQYSPYLTPAETLRFFGELHGFGRQRIELETTTLLQRLRIFDSRKKLNSKLSKGMLQRVGIAQALMGAPQLLILDEVSSGLDPIGRRELRQILSEERDRGATVFFSSHELTEISTLCDRVIVIDKGRIIAESSIAELKGTDLEEYFIETVIGSRSAA